jgi:protein-S-isoprenylcysteine O-methyltransferase Ste14
MIASAIGYILMLGFFGLELFGRKPYLPKSFKAGPGGRGSTVFLGIANTTATLLSPLLNRLGLGRLPQGTLISPAGIALMAVGLGVRFWAMRLLGQFYTRSLRISEGQKLMDEGPYHLVRHPGYLGTLLTWIGLPLALSNWLSAVLVAGAMAAAYRLRIPAEEAMLIESFGDPYRRYMQHTKSLLPFIL